MSTLTAPRPTAETNGGGPRPASDFLVPDVRRTLLALLASALGVVPLCELFVDRAWLIEVWFCMAVVIAPAAVLRVRRRPSAAQIWIGIVLLVPTLTIGFLPQHAYAGVIPSGATFHQIGRLMTSLHHTSVAQAAPVQTTVAVRLTVCALMALVAALVDLIAVVGRRGALAGVPLLVVFTVSGAVPRSPVSWWLFAIAAAGFLILLGLDSRDDLSRWGHYVRRSDGSGRLTGGAISGQRIAAAAIAAAVVLPLLVPSNSRNFVSNLFHGGGSGSGSSGFGASGSGGIDPFVALRGELNRNDPIDLLNVRVRSLSGDKVGTSASVQPFYLRTNVLSDFIGVGWRAGSAGQTEAVDQTQFASSPGVAFPPHAVGFAAHVSVLGLSSNPPVFGDPTDVNGLDPTTNWDRANQLLVGGQVTRGDGYDLTVSQTDPTVGELDAANGVDSSLRPWLALPTIPDSVHSLVTRLLASADATSQYAKARAISDFFTDPNDHFIYSLSTKAGDSGSDLVDFLKNRVGYCQQYAAAMGVMLRLAGVPARVVLGYTHPVPDRNGSFTVTTNDAHAWVEAYFQGVGWVPFDPTPLSGIAGGAVNDLQWAPHGGGGKDTESTGPVVPTVRQSTSAGRTSSSAVAPVHQATGGGSSGPGVLMPLLLLVIVALIVTLALIPWAVRSRRRRVRMRHARHGDTAALWQELADIAVDLGYVWSGARTPRQVAHWLATPAGPAADSLRDVAAAVERDRYAPPGATPRRDGDELVRRLDAVRAGLRSGRTTRQRIGMALWPSSLGWHAPVWPRLVGAGPVLGRQH